MKTVRYCNDTFEAHIIRGRLENGGIPSAVINENLNTVMPYASAIPSFTVQVVVADEDAERAATLLDSEPEASTETGHDAETRTETGIACPHCGSYDVTFGFWEGKRGWKRIGAFFLFLLAAASLSPVGNMRNRYYCRACRGEFKP